MSIKSFLMKRLLAAKMRDVPADQQEKIMAMVEKNPELFQKIALEVQEKMKAGKDQMTAMMEVMQLHQAELQKIMAENK